MGADETTIIFGHSITLQVLVAVRSIPTIVVVPTCGASVVAHEVVLLVVAATEELEGPWVSIVTDCSQDHVVTLLQGQIANILHCLDEWKGAPVGTSGLLLEMHGERLLMIQIVAAPEAE